MAKRNTQDDRIESIVGDAETFEDGVDRFYDHLKKSLQLPCDVTGIEDFNWEEIYVIGPGDPEEYKELRKDQPSFQDKFELLAIEKDEESEWMMFGGDDLAAHVRRKSDGKEFYLGLAELEVVNKKSPNYQLIDDYAVWFVNSR